MINFYEQIYVAGEKNHNNFILHVDKEQQLPSAKRCLLGVHILEPFHNCALSGRFLWTLPVLSNGYGELHTLTIIQ